MMSSLQVIKKHRNCSREKYEQRGHCREQRPVKPRNLGGPRLEALQHRRPKVAPQFRIRMTCDRLHRLLQNQLDAVLVLLLHGSTPCRFNAFLRRGRARKTRTLTAPTEMPSASAIS